MAEENEPGELLKEVRLPDLAKNITRISTGDGVTAVVKAAFNDVPLVGGSIASLLDDFIPASRERRIREFAEGVASDLEQIKSQLKIKYVTTDEFAYLFTRVFQNLTRDYQQSKINAYRGLLVNSLRYDIDASVVESYLKRVEDLTALHLDVLTCFYSDRYNQSRLGVANNPYQVMGTFGSLMGTLKRLLPRLTEGQIEAAVFDLDRANITNNVYSVLHGTMTGMGAMDLEGRLTAYGSNFVRFISTP